MNDATSEPRRSGGPDEPSLLPGVNVLLMGPAGTGKTYSIGTLVDSGVETFFLPLETGMGALLRYFNDRGKPPPPNLHWHEPIGIGRDISDLASMAEDIGKLPQESLYKMVDMTRAVNNQFAKVHRVMEDFIDQNGKSFGKVTKWGPDRALVLDGLTGFGRFALHMAAGKKPVLSQPDWGIAQKQVENFLQLMCDSRCHFILLGHVEREIDQVTGGVKVMVRSLGRALPPIIPPMFNDVVLTVREGTKWSWDTAASNVDLKTVHLPVSAGQPPSFAPIIDKWRGLGGRFTATIKTGTRT